MDKWYTLFLNPEPWAVGSVSIGKRDGHHVGRISPNPNLAAFQKAVKEELANVKMLTPDYRKFEFYFWRQQARYIDAADRVRQRNQADATNLQKGLEDALQGVLFENDREVADIRSIIIAQGPGIPPLIIIRAMKETEQPLKDVPDDLLTAALRRAESPLKVVRGDKWSDSEELF